MADEKRPTGADSPVSDPEKSSPLYNEDISPSHAAPTGKHTFAHHDPNWDGNDVDFSRVDEKAVLRKMDLRLLPMLALLYLLSFLDRGNIGNAKIEGLTETLHMTGPEYNWCLTVFFFTYCAFEVPSNLMLKRLRPSIWLPTIMVAWGIVMTLMGIVQSYHGLLIARLFLGVAEAGLFPGVAYYITMWYCRHEGQLRQALFFSAASIAGAFSGLLAFAIAKMDGVGGLDGWRWIFILEGIATVLVAISAFFVLHDFPDTASFLTIEERAWVVHRLKYQGSAQSSHQVAETEGFKWKYVKAAFADWQIYVALWMYWGIVCPLYGISLFLPTIINELGYVSSTAQLLTVPIYITAAILTIVVAYYSDKSKYGRAPFIFIPMCAILIGFIIALAASAHGHLPGLVYAGVFITTCGIYPAFPGNITWISNNIAGSYKRSAGMAFHIGAGNLAGAMASNFYRAADKPKYLLGHGLEIGFVSAGLVAVAVLRTGYMKVNDKRDREGNERGLSVKEMSELGDKSPSFRYMT
ncbi:probable permease of the major facilitator superfamily [Phialocephala subalpina]|uniref:Probable permease of the major facilitator superfamily n=1 Tax=Phialocephala subalpina TaxID=576137 RepID=A0A1L7XDZ3_9HELO|nr:probable permease of the major facilitator superfamily [Phialocephala subalpina]